MLRSSPLITARNTFCAAGCGPAGSISPSAAAAARIVLRIVASLAIGGGHRSMR
jgi:hypothetical protein